MTERADMVCQLMVYVSVPYGYTTRPEAPGHLYLGQAAAVPTSGQLQVPSEDPLIYEFERER
jgi:hypothetical protein